MDRRIDGATPRGLVAVHGSTEPLAGFLNAIGGYSFALANTNNSFARTLASS